MERFKYGIMVLNPSLGDDEGVPIVHFVGYWSEPKEEDLIDLKREIETDESIGLIDMVDDLEYYIAPDDIVEYYNDICLETGAFNGEQDIDEISLN